MADKTTETQPQTLDDADLEQAVGGKVKTPVAPKLKPVYSNDPCDGGE